MAISKSFAPIASENSTILILGSMPGVASLQKQQYYGHPRNAFWPIMGSLFGALPEFDYRQRTEILLDNNIAVWDVLQSCYREGSLDADIKQTSININHFADFFLTHRFIRQVFFNGKTAEKLYKKHVLPILESHLFELGYQSLPSTSPAYASLTLEQKLNAWRAIKIEITT